MIDLPAIGRCQCGECVFEIQAQPFVAYTCHCKACQRLTASAFNTCLQAPAESVVITQGEPAIQTRNTPTANVLSGWFCPRCSSALFLQHSARPRVRTVLVGCLDAAHSVPVNAHIWVESKLPWVVLPPGHRIF